MITCKYLQINEHQAVSDVSTIHTPLAKPTWRDFDISGIAVQHFMNLTVGSKTAVVLRINDIVLSNSAKVRQQYHKIAAKDGLTVLDIAKADPFDGLVLEWKP